MGGPGTLFGATGLRQSNAAGSSSHVSILSCRAGAPARSCQRSRQAWRAGHAAAGCAGSCAAGSGAPRQAAQPPQFVVARCLVVVGGTSGQRVFEPGLVDLAKAMHAEQLPAAHAAQHSAAGTAGAYDDVGLALHDLANRIELGLAAANGSKLRVLSKCTFRATWSQLKCVGAALSQPSSQLRAAGAVPIRRQAGAH